MKNVFAFVSLLAIVLTMGVSCIQVQQVSEQPAGAVTNEQYGRLSGNYTANLGCSLFEADKAVRAAAKSLNLHELSRENNTSYIQYEFKDVYEARISVTLNMDANGQAKIAIKFAKIGDKDFSKKFINAIDEQLHAQE